MHLMCCPAWELLQAQGKHCCPQSCLMHLMCPPVWVMLLKTLVCNEEGVHFCLFAEVGAREVPFWLFAAVGEVLVKALV